MTKKNKLKNIRIREISLVDKAANNRIFIYKKAELFSGGDLKAGESLPAQHTLAQMQFAVQALTASLEAIEILHADLSASRAV